MPKILVVGDVHFKSFAHNRLDNVMNTQLGKMTQVFRIANEQKVDAIIQVGDLFNTPEVANELLSEVISLFRLNTIPFYTILGQHDKYMRSGIEKSPVRVLKEAGLIDVLGKDGASIHRGIDAYGCHFGDEVPVPEDDQTNNILVIHKMIHPDKLYPTDEGFDTPRRFLSDHPEYQIILCGDYHGSFEYEQKNRGIYNPGALTRQTISDQAKHPHVLLIEAHASKFTCEKIAIDCLDNPFKERVAKAQDASAGLQEMLQRLRQGADSMSLEKSAEMYFEREQTPLPTQKLVWEYLQENTTA